MDLIEKLQQIREGKFILEANDDNKYSLDDTGEKTKTGDDIGSDNIDYSIPDKSSSDSGTNDDDTSSSNYDLPTNDSNNDDTGDEPATTDNTDNSNDLTTNDGDQNSDSTSKQGEVLAIDPDSRDILQYKNFIAYRQLRDSVKYKLTELAELPSFSTVDRQVIDLAINKLTDLLTKLNDYIIYKYKDISYEQNYINFTNFILEKNLIMSLVEQINTTNK